MEYINKVIELIGFEARKMTQVEANRKCLEKYEGSYVYYIVDKRTQSIVYIGETGNIVNRYNDHYHRPTLKSGLSYWCNENGEDKANYQMLVLDLTDIEMLDYDDRLLIESMLQYYHKDTIINKRIPKKLEAYEVERFEDICAMIDFDFKPYREVKQLKMSNKKVLGLPTEELEDCVN
mgnify:CR=1 FL=1